MFRVGAVGLALLLTSCAGETDTRPRSGQESPPPSPPSDPPQCNVAVAAELATDATDKRENSTITWPEFIRLLDNAASLAHSDVGFADETGAIRSTVDAIDRLRVAAHEYRGSVIAELRDEVWLAYDALPECPDRGRAPLPPGLTESLD